MVGQSRSLTSLVLHSIVTAKTTLAKTVVMTVLRFMLFSICTILLFLLPYVSLDQAFNVSINVLAESLLVKTIIEPG